MIPDRGTRWPLTQHPAVVAGGLADALPGDEYSNIVMGTPPFIEGLLPGAEVNERHVCIPGDLELAGGDSKQIGIILLHHLYCVSSSHIPIYYTL